MGEPATSICQAHGPTGHSAPRRSGSGTFVEGATALHDSQLIQASGHPIVLNRRVYFACKRMMDLAFASLALLVAAPRMALIALWIKLDSPGPVLFKQARLGQSG